MNYLDAIRQRVRTGHTRRELRRLFWCGTGRVVPAGVNLRTYVAEWHTQQQAINSGVKPSGFYLKTVGIQT